MPPSGRERGWALRCGRRKKSPYRKDTGVPELLLPRCANGIDQTGLFRGGSREFR
jgi:hypothetical protein